MTGKVQANKPEEVKLEAMWTSKDVMIFLNIGRDKLTELIQKKKLPYRRFGNAYRYHPIQIKAWLEAQQ